MSLLAGLSVAQLGPGNAAAVCGRLFADAGADIKALGADYFCAFTAYLNDGKTPITGAASADMIASADVIIVEGGPAVLRAREHDIRSLRRQNGAAAIILISNFGQTGPRADAPATDLTLFAASGIARLLTGQVDDLAEPPVRATGEQSAFIGGAAAACAGMHAALQTGGGAVIDVSLQEALATLAITELARGGQSGRSWSRKRLADGNGATVTILPARDGYVAISPREERQWTAWLEAMGAPAWGHDPRFARKPDRVANWDALYALMSAWSRELDKQHIAELAQAAHVPSLPVRDLAEHFASPQLAARGFFQPLAIADRQMRAPSAPYKLTFTGDGSDIRLAPPTGDLPLSGVRVLDFSWVIAGPTATRYLAAFGADVIKVEAPGRGDPGRASELHAVLGQAKQAIVLDLKQPAAVDVARALAAESDIVVENFANGVMERLGLGPDDLQTLNPDLIYLSASGMGRTGPEAEAVAYGTLLQCFAGFAGLNRHQDRPPRVGFAWLDPMCGLLLPFITAAAIWRRRRGSGGVRVDFSMIEAMLWTMAKPLMAQQLGATPTPVGNASGRFSPHGVYPCKGEDAWLAIAVTTDEQWRRLAQCVPGLAEFAELGLAGRSRCSAKIEAALTHWTEGVLATQAAETLTKIDVPTAALATSTDLVADAHLDARGFWDAHAGGVLPGLPWRASFGRKTGAAPGLGADTVATLENLLGLAPEKIAALRRSGAIG